MDNINDLENSSKEQLVEKVESMQEEIDSLKEENSAGRFLPLCPLDFYH